MPRGAFLASYREQLSCYSRLVVDNPDKDNCLVIITIDKDALIVSLSSLIRDTFHGIPNVSNDDLIEKIIIYIIMGIAASLIKIGQNELAAKILLDNKIKKHFFAFDELVMQTLPNLMHSSKYDEIIDTVCNVMMTSDNNFLENIATMSALVSLDSRDPSRYDKFAELLNKILEKSISLGEKSLIGISHYNLGNNYRYVGLNRKSIYHYLEAKKYEPNYLKQIYYFKELAGVFFRCGKYNIASRLYKKALDMGAEEYVKPLYADALMFDGKYQQAVAIFSEYLKINETSRPEWPLKLICLRNLIKITDNPSQIRYSNKALKLMDNVAVNSSLFMEKVEEALRLDNLCGLAWFNRGISESQSGKSSEAAYSFALCGLVQTWDIEAWVNATLSCFIKDMDVQLLTLIIQTAYYYNSENYLLSLHKELGKRIHGENLKTSINMIEEILPKSIRGKDEPKLRLMCNDGFFRDILTGQNQ